VPDLLVRPGPSRPTGTGVRPARGGPDGRPAYVAPVPAALAAVAVAVGIGVVLCAGLAVLGWLADPAADVVAAARVGVWAWLLANGSALHVSAPGPGTVDSAATAAVAFSGTVAVAPLGLSALLVAVLARATAGAVRAAVPPLVVAGSAREARALARDATRREVRPLLTVAISTAALYVAAAAAVGRFLGGGAHLIRVDGARTLVGATVVGLLGTGLGVVAGCGGWRRQLRRAPSPVAAAGRGAAAGAALLLAAAAALLSAAVLGHLTRVVELSRALGGGTIGQSLLTVAQVALLGQGLAYALSWLAGAGFTLGAGTIIAPTGVVLGPLPAVPALGALPDPGAQPLWASALVVVPAVAGLLAGAVAVRSVRRAAATAGAEDAGVRGVAPTAPGTRFRTVATAAAAAAAGGLGVGLLATGVLAVSRAQLGSGRLAAVGPVVGPAALVLLVGCPLAAVLACLPPAVRVLLAGRDRDVEPDRDGREGSSSGAGGVEGVDHEGVDHEGVDHEGIDHEGGVGSVGVEDSGVGSVDVRQRGRVGSATHALLDGVAERLRALLGRRLRPAAVLDAGERPGQLGPEHDERGEHRQHQQDPDSADRDGDRSPTGADTGAPGLADGPDATDEGSQSGTAGQQEGQTGHPGSTGVESRSDEDEAGSDEGEAQRPAAGTVG